MELQPLGTDPSVEQRNKWRDADDWSDRDWNEQWERQRQIFHEREEVEEAEEQGHHNNGKHLGWYRVRES